MNRDPGLGGAGWPAATALSSSSFFGDGEQYVYGLCGQARAP